MKYPHPCYQEQIPSCAAGRIHVPVADACCVKCIYCSYATDQNVSQRGSPGSCERVISDRASMRKFLDDAFARYPDVDLIGVCGPGDPCSSQSNLTEFVELAKKDYPDKTLCMCTNGLQLSELYSSGLLANFGYVTITINTLNPRRIAKIYRDFDRTVVKDEEDFVVRQLKAIEICREKSVVVKINTVFLPQINMDELPMLLRETRERGASVHNLIPLVSMDRDCTYRSKYREVRENLRSLGFALLHHCRRCRSDACGYI